MTISYIWHEPGLPKQVTLIRWRIPMSVSYQTPHNFSYLHSVCSDIAKRFLSIRWVYSNYRRSYTSCYQLLLNISLSHHDYVVVTRNSSELACHQLRECHLFFAIMLRWLNYRYYQRLLNISTSNWESFVSYTIVGNQYECFIQILIPYTHKVLSLITIVSSNQVILSQL